MKSEEIHLAMALVDNNEPTREYILKTDIDGGGKVSIYKFPQINYTTHDFQRCSDTIELWIWLT